MMRATIVARCVMLVAVTLAVSCARPGPSPRSSVRTAPPRPVARPAGKRPVARHVAVLPSPPRPVLRDVVVRGHRITLDLSKQKLRVRLATTFYEWDAEKRSPILGSSLTGYRSYGFTAVTLLALKAKQFDDGLMVALGAAAHGGLGRLPSKQKLVLDLLAELSRGAGNSSNNPAVVRLATAGRLGDPSLKLGRALQAEVRREQLRFLRRPIQSMVMGPHDGSALLRRIFQRNRYLQQPLEPSEQQLLERVLRASPDLLKRYRTLLQLQTTLTDVPAFSALAEDPGSRAFGTTSAVRQTALFPPADSLSRRVMRRLFGGRRSITPGFRLDEHLARGIKGGRIQMRPGPEAGWFPRQLYALEPFIVPDRMPEAAKLDLGPVYKGELRRLFRALLALTSETHLEATGGIGVGGWSSALVIRNPVSVDPQPTYYLRQAQAYRFLRLSLGRLLGGAALDKIRRLRASGPVRQSLLAELRWMEALFHGAYLQSCEELGLRPASALSLGSGKGAQHDRRLFSDWAEELASDPDLSGDIRAMVPIAYDLGRGRYRVWVVLGLAKRPVAFSYVAFPRVVSVHDPRGNRLELSKVDVRFKRETRHDYVVLVSAEVEVRRLLPRKAFRRLCDRLKTAERILAYLRR